MMEMVGGASSSKASSARSRRSRRRPAQDQNFSNYLTLGFQATICLGIFFVMYALILLCLFPLLGTGGNNDISSSEHQQQQHKKKKKMVETYKHKGEALKPVIDNLPGAETIQQRLFQFRKARGVTDASLMDNAVEEFNAMRRRRGKKDAAQAAADIAMSGGASAKVMLNGNNPAGFMVLGMHRSGTSMLSGLMVTGMGYNVGGPLIGGAFDNVKGFFERVDAVLQNDEFMGLQGVWWAQNVMAYDPQKAVEDKKSGRATFKNGETALAFLNDPNNAPWLQKDPRMCITLPTWLALLDREPAVVFTYRHPLEVAKSLKKREKAFPLERGLRLWIIYNIRAVQNSAKLCRVLSSNEAILEDPLKEVQRIADELTTRCHVPKPPRELTQEDVDKFVDPNLQHNTQERKAAELDGGNVIADYGGCKVMDYESDYEAGSSSYDRERGLYNNAMKMYCDFQSGKAYEDGYEWPVLT